MPNKTFTIGQVARIAGVTPRAIRLYERHGMLAPATRNDANYRLFSEQDINRLKFIAACRSLGFSIPEVKALLEVMDKGDQTCGRVAKLAREHLDLVHAKMEELNNIRLMLTSNLDRCTKPDSKNCPIVEFLRKERPYHAAANPEDSGEGWHSPS